MVCVCVCVCVCVRVRARARARARVCVCVCASNLAPPFGMGQRGNGAGLTSAYVLHASRSLAALSAQPKLLRPPDTPFALRQESRQNERYSVSTRSGWRQTS